jgi:hypothetical protein
LDTGQLNNGMGFSNMKTQATLRLWRAAANTMKLPKTPSGASSNIVVLLILRHASVTQAL